MDFQRDLDEQEHDGGIPYSVFLGLNIHFEGLVFLEVGDRDYSRSPFFNANMQKGSEIIECSRAYNIKNTWQICCKADSKKEAIELIKKYAEAILKTENILSASIGININLYYLNHKEIGHPLVDPIDYNLFNSFREELIPILPKILEPLEVQYFNWSNGRWSK